MAGQIEAAAPVAAGVVRQEFGRFVGPVVTLAAAAGAAAILVDRADGWALDYGLGNGASVVQWLAVGLVLVTAAVGLAGWRSTSTGVLLRVVTVVVTAWAVGQLPFDVLRVARLVPLPASGWGMSLRLLLVTAAMGALVTGRSLTLRHAARCPGCGRRKPGGLARLPRWPALVALVFAGVYPLWRIHWALGGTVGTNGRPEDAAQALQWTMALLGTVLVAFTVVLAVGRGPSWLRWPLGLGGAAVGFALFTIGAGGSLEVVGMLTGDGREETDLAPWAFGVVYGCWTVVGPALAAASVRYWVRRREDCVDCRGSLGPARGPAPGEP